LTYLEAEKAVEFEADGTLHRLGIYEPLELVSKEEWEASLPPHVLQEAMQAAKEEAERFNASTPGRFGQPDGHGPRKNVPNKKGKKGGGQRSSSKPIDGAGSDAGQAGTGLLGIGDPGNLGSGDGKKILKLPEAQFVEIDDYEIDDAPPLPTSYYRFIEKTAEEQDEEVEYDMDEEDVAWLNIINEKRASENQNKIHEDQFELLMDRLEKESYFHVQTNGSKDYSAPIDEDAICCVCMDGECSNTNVILFCDLCNLAVHQECYGVPYIPEGQWLCRRCLQSPSRSVECCLCPNRGGAFKQTDDGRWAHVVCGLWIPEVRFANTVFLEPIDSIDNIPPARWKLSCRVCKQRGVGACIQCHKTNCYTAFHVTCGLLAGLHMKMDTVREPSAAGSLSVTVRKTAYCDVHTPLDSDCKPKLDDVAALGINTPKQKALKGNEKPSKKSNRENGTGQYSDGPGAAAPVVPVLFRGLMNFSPQCPWDKVQEIASLINVQRKNQFFQRLMAYWTLKRQTRNGVPLIRRLQFAKATRPDKAPETPQKNAHHNRKKKEREKEIAKKAKSELSGMVDERRSLRRLRQDLERVRLLCELIRKREQRKRDLINNKAQIVELQCFPLTYSLRKVMNLLLELDQQEIFTEPVSLEDVPDYLDHIRAPMDMQSMSAKLESFEYLTLDDLEHDFNLMVDNCLSYNERDTLFFRAGTKMRDQGGTIIRQARREMESVGFDIKTGLHTEERLSQKEELSDDKLMKEIDSFMGGGDLNSGNVKESGIPTAEERGMTQNDYLARLLELQDTASLLHHPVAKVKRLKLLKQEITKVRRKLSMDRTGTSPGHKGHKFKTVGAVGNDELLESDTVCATNKKNITEEIISPGNARRLRAGKEIEMPPGISKPAKLSIQGKKRKNQSESDSSEGEHQNKKLSTEYSTPETGSAKATASLIVSSPAKSPAGVNRRNAILFTRKKQLGKYYYVM
jgi:bromodomain and PHD finger-containing protein 1